VPAHHQQQPERNSCPKNSTRRAKTQEQARSRIRKKRRRDGEIRRDCSGTRRISRTICRRAFPPKAESRSEREWRRSQRGRGFGRFCRPNWPNSRPGFGLADLAPSDHHCAEKRGLMRQPKRKISRGETRKSGTLAMMRRPPAAAKKRFGG